MLRALLPSCLLVASLVAANPLLQPRATCNADNCARAVTGTEAGKTPSVASRSADCVSFLVATVIPLTTTTVTSFTSTVTTVVTSQVATTPLTTTTTTVAPANKKRATSMTAVTSSPGSVPSYASACSGTARYSSACSCFGATPSTKTASTSTITSTLMTVATMTAFTTVTSTASTSVVVATATGNIVYPAPSSCGNIGVQWAYYYDSTDFYSNSALDAYDPSPLKAEQPDATGVTDYLHYNDNDGSVYGDEDLDDMFFALNHRGYLFVPVTGTYQFAATNVDDIVDVWTGPVAYSGWNNGNRFQYVRYENGAGNGLTKAPGVGTTTGTLTAGTYVPFRLIYKQGHGGGSFDYTVTGPGGILIAGNSAATPSNYIVQFSCDGTTAPAYPPFGQET